jgi:hypothetical protein
VTARHLSGRCVSVGCMWMILFSLACSNPDPVGGQEAASSTPETLEPVVAVPEHAALPTPGLIGGEPILPSPVVLGAISANDVKVGVQAKMADINRCYQDALVENKTLSGKVLVRFTIDEDGRVSKTGIRSTSLRHATTEACVVAKLSEVRFPSLEHGRVAIVTYPFVFGIL